MLISFGCLAFVSTLNSSRTKFYPHAIACVFIGYKPRMKAFKFLDLETRQIFMSRDSVFHENIFPLLKQHINPMIIRSIFRLYLLLLTLNWMMTQNCIIQFLMVILFLMIMRKSYNIHLFLLDHKDLELNPHTYKTIIVTLFKINQ